MNKEIRALIMVLTGAASISAFIAYFIALKTFADVHIARTICFATLSLGPLLYIFSIRRLAQPIWRSDIASNRFLLGAVVASFAALLVVLYIPAMQTAFGTTALTMNHWLLVVGFAIVQVIAIEVAKVFWGRRLHSQAAIA